MHTSPARAEFHVLSCARVRARLRIGSYNHWKIDADTFASWGVDYVKIDYCGGHDSPQGHRAMSQAMNATGRHMVLALCRGPYQEEENWG